MATFDRRQLQRLSYLPGQDLRARDFREQAAVEAQLRWWHNRAEHAAFGVRFGLQAVPEPQPLAPDHTATSVAVSPGLGYDAFGRERILARKAHLALPASPAGIGGSGQPTSRVLVLRWVEAEPGSGCAAAPPPTFDLCGKPPRVAATAELAWIDGTWPRPLPADGVPLARLQPDAAGALAWDLAFRPPLVEPIVRPRFASGATLAGGTAWTGWSVSHHDEPMQVGLQVWIDTSAAGFTEMPIYFAWLRGSLDGAAPTAAHHA